ncbi:MAG: nuclear transport factor 2 family protein [Bdellovibrionota bacterium]
MLEKLYAALAEGSVDGALAHCDDKITFQIPGKSPLAGKFTKADYASRVVEKRRSLSGGTLKTEVHDILASDRHGTVLASETFTRNGQPVQLRTVHVWRIEGGKPVAFYEYPRDLYQFDQAWNL